MSTREKQKRLLAQDSTGWLTATTTNHQHQRPQRLSHCIHDTDHLQQGSYRSSIVKLHDFSVTFQVMQWQFPWPYRNNNPSTQMLEMVHYIQRFIITMKHVIYGAILSAARWSGGNRIWCILAWKSDIWWHHFFIFSDFSLTFPKNIFSRPFPDHSNSLTFSSFPWPVGTLELLEYWLWIRPDSVYLVFCFVAISWRKCCYAILAHAIPFQALILILKKLKTLHSVHSNKFS